MPAVAEEATLGVGREDREWLGSDRRYTLDKHKRSVQCSIAVPQRVRVFGRGIPLVYSFHGGELDNDNATRRCLTFRNMRLGTARQVATTVSSDRSCCELSI